MAQMNRNVNLEEIDSDALFGLDALKNQTLVQKLVFWSCLISGMLINALLPVFFNTSRLVCFFAFMMLLLVGIAFGCNYTEEMTYGKYLYYFFFRPKQDLKYESTEDVARIREKAVELKAEEELLLRAKEQADPKAQKKLLIRLLVFVTVLALGVGGIFIYGSIKDKNNVHHQVEVLEVEND